MAEEIPYTRNHYLNEIISKRRNEGLRRLVAQVVREMASNPAAAASAIEALFEANERRECEMHAVLEVQVSLQGPACFQCRHLLASPELRQSSPFRPGRYHHDLFTKL